MVLRFHPLILLRRFVPVLSLAPLSSSKRFLEAPTIVTTHDPLNFFADAFDADHDSVVPDDAEEQKRWHDLVATLPNDNFYALPRAHRGGDDDEDGEDLFQLRSGTNEDRRFGREDGGLDEDGAASGVNEDGFREDHLVLVHRDLDPPAPKNSNKQRSVLGSHDRSSAATQAKTNKLIPLYVLNGSAARRKTFRVPDWAESRFRNFNSTPPPDWFEEMHILPPAPLEDADGGGTAYLDTAGADPGRDVPYASEGLRRRFIYCGSLRFLLAAFIIPEEEEENLFWREQDLFWRGGGLPRVVETAGGRTIRGRHVGEQLLGGADRTSGIYTKRKKEELHCNLHEIASSLSSLLLPSAETASLSRKRSRKRSLCGG